MINIVCRLNLSLNRATFCIKQKYCSPALFNQIKRRSVSNTYSPPCLVHSRTSLADSFCFVREDLVNQKLLIHAFMSMIFLDNPIPWGFSVEIIRVLYKAQQISSLQPPLFSRLPGCTLEQHIVCSHQQGFR